MSLLAVVTLVCLLLAAVVVVLTGVRALRDRPPADADLAVGALLGLGVLVYDGVRVADLVGGYRPPGMVLAVAYLVGIALVMPAALLLGLAERSRWGAVTIGAGAIVVAVLFARIDQVWVRG